MKDDKTVEIVIIVVDNLYDFCPKRRLHVRRVDGRIELVGRDAIIETFQFGNMFEKMVEVEIFKRTCLRVFYHTDGSASIYQ